MPPLRRRSATAALLAGLAILPGCGDDASSSASPNASIEINGAGATFPEPIYAKWAGKFAELNDVAINYQPIGSGGGIAQAKARTVDFGASDAPIKSDEIDQTDLIQWPMVIGGVVPVVNVEGVGPGQLHLTADVLVSLLLGKITRWNDPAIAELNPDLELPARDVTVVYRADPSGTTWIYTNYLAAASPRWKERVGADKGVDWPVGIAGKGNQGVATYVSRIKGAIGYVEFAYAKLAGMTTVLLRNKAGRDVAPSLQSFQAAAMHADWRAARNFYLVLVDQPGDDTWPIVGASFLVVQRAGHEPRQLAAMLHFFDWCFAHGADLARELDYVPMPEVVVAQVRDLWKSTWPEAFATLPVPPATTASSAPAGGFP